MNEMKKSWAERWLWLGVVSLALAGVFAVVLVVARTPQLAMFTELFSVALVIHVDLSVLMWFLSMLGMGLALMIARVPEGWPYWRQAGWWVMAAATALMALSPLHPEWEVIKSNYIPVLHNPVFLLALGLVFSGLVVMVIPPIITFATSNHWRTLGLVEMGWLMAAVVVALALLAFYLSARAMAPGLPHAEHYEILFWAGGHIWQFAFCLLMMAAWLVLLEALGLKAPARGWVMIAYAITLLGAFVSFLGFAMYPADSSDFTYHQTKVMKEWGGLGVGLMSVLVLVALRRLKPVRATRAYASILVVSLLLFAGGGVLGLMIAGQNVMIPAHYHGVIVAITLALMGLAYAMLPRFGYASVAATRMAFWQPIVYGLGQLMHIGGLAYSGGYGVLRKTAGAAANSLTPDVKIAMGIMGTGGLLAVIGGVLFVLVMWRAYAGQKKLAS
jgi:cytochrome c oxidase subunit 1